MSRTLLKYVGKLYLTFFGVLLLAVLGVFLVGDFGDRLRAYIDNPISDVLLLYWFKLLVAVQQLAPAAMLLAASAAVSTLRKRGEWTAMQALGASRWVVVLPVLISGAVLASGLVYFDDRVATHAGAQVDDITVHRFKRWGDYMMFYAPKQWLRVGDTVFHVRGERGDDGVVSDVSMFQVDKDFRVARRLDAQKVVPLGGERFRLEQGVERRFSPDGEMQREDFASREVTLAGMSPQTFRVRVGRAEYMPLKELLGQQEVRRKVGLPTERLALAVHNRFAYPFTGVVAAVLAALIALRPGRKGHLTLALVEGLTVTVVLFTSIMAARSLALGEHLSPAMAAWAPVGGLAVVTALLWAYWEGRLFPKRAPQ